MFQRGFSYCGWSSREYLSTDSDQALENLAATGTKWIALLVTGYQDNVVSTSINWTSSGTPTDEALTHAIVTARSLGMEVMLKPHVDFRNDDAHARWQIGTEFTTEEQFQEWLSSYERGILHYAELAQAQGVKQFCVGTELQGMTSRESEWRSMISKVRARFTGKITYASLTSEGNRITWWDAVDYIGVNAYFPLVDKVNPTVDEIKAAWVQRGWLQSLRTLSAKWNKPILFTEIGYRSIDGAVIKPWVWRSSGVANEKEQANAYQAAFETFINEPWFMGFYWWSWSTQPSRGGPQDTGFTPHNKAATEVLKKFYSPRYKDLER